MAPRKKTIGLSLLAVGWALFVGAHAQATEVPASTTFSRRCRLLTDLTLEQLVGIKPGFEHNTTYAYRLPTTPVRDQCDYGSCWIYSTVGELETAVLKNTGQRLDLSEQFLIIQSLRMRALDALEAPGQKIIQGGWNNLSYWLIDQHGIVPASVWKPRIPFEESKASRRLVAWLQSRVAEYHVSAARITDPAAREVLLAEARAQVLEQIELFSGEMPRSFAWQGVELTPRDFAHRTLPIDNHRLIRVRPSRPELPPSIRNLIRRKNVRPKMPKKETLRWDLKVSSGQAPIEHIEAEIRNYIAKHGRSVTVGLEIDHVFIDKSTGVMSLSAFHTPEGFVHAPVEYRAAFGTDGGKHAVEIVGVDVDDEGRVIKYLVKNSWGVDSGDQGFYHLYADYFNEYLVEAIFRAPGSQPPTPQRARE